MADLQRECHEHQCRSFQRTGDVHHGRTPWPFVQLECRSPLHGGRYELRGWFGCLLRRQMNCRPKSAAHFRATLGHS
jgi:hypothetical protein